MLSDLPKAINGNSHPLSLLLHSGLALDSLLSLGHFLKDLENNWLPSMPKTILHI